MSMYHEQVADAIQATVFSTPTTYTWFGKLSERLPLMVKRALTPETTRNYLLFSLQSQLYKYFYCQGFAVPITQKVVDLRMVRLRPFMQKLSAANVGSGGWEGGWEVHAVRDGEIMVGKGGLELWVRPEDVLVPEASPVLPDMRLSVRRSKELAHISPGFYMALSDKEFIHDGSQPLVRFYWNLTAEGAVPFIRHVTALLNQANLPFKVKVLHDPSRFTRCDAGVLYICKSDYESVSERLARLYPDVSTSLSPGIPTFTKPLAAGLGVAEDPGSGESFGLHRCQLLADGMIRAYEQGKKSVNERLQVIEDRFVEVGISLEQPFLNPGSGDIYYFHPRHRQQLHPSHNVIRVARREPNAEMFLRTAAEIGQRLSQEAVWYQENCNWLGVAPVEHSSLNGHASRIYRALGPDLYSGTSGVALFLAQLYAATDSVAARHTALGAIRQALSHVDAVPPPSRLGFFNGWAGIALASARIGVILGQEELLERSAHLLHRLAREPQDVHEFDLLAGNAGAIAVLVILCDLLNDASLLDFAVRLGDELLHAAEKSTAGYSWKSATFPTRWNLTGFSHGAAGVGYALLELFSATGDSKYCRAAELAFQYERHWFDADVGNWLDFRREPDQGKHSKRPRAFVTQWCHGAPGIALSRLRAYDLLKAEVYKTEATIALRTTITRIETTLHSRLGDYSLCHGLAGNAEILLSGSQVLGPAWADSSALAMEVAQAGIETYAMHGLPWPCGSGPGETPSFMLGLAGIGYFYLRLHDSATPSILLLQREQVVAK